MTEQRMRVGIGQFNEMTDEILTFAAQLGVTTIQMNSPRLPGEVRWESADVRALVIVGELDRVTPIAEAMSLRSLLKGELVIVPNVGHLPNVEDPLAFNEALVRFLTA